MPKIAALIVAAGRGERAGDGPPKQYRPLAGRSVLARSIDAMLASPRVTAAIVAIREEHWALYDAAAPADPRLLPPVVGGDERALTVRAGLEALAADPPDIVLIHDAARPFATSATVERVIDALAEADGAFAASPVYDSLRVVEDGAYVRPLPRDGVWRAETPQGFRFDAILAAHRASDDAGASDDAEIARRAGLRVVASPSDGDNFKITAPDDFARAERSLAMSAGDLAAPETRTGFGYDVHAFAPGDAVILCGVAIPHDRALKGHSDADVAMHALTDAIFGAIGEGDIGRWFPPSDPQWKGAASRIFLEKAMERLRARGGALTNADVTIICEQPKIGPHAGAMIAALAEIMAVDPARLSVKATTSERLGFTGRKEGVAATAVATVRTP